MLVAERNVVHAVMHETGQGGDASRLLSTTHTGGADEEAEVFAIIRSQAPLLAGAVPEDLGGMWLVGFFESREMWYSEVPG